MQGRSLQKTRINFCGRLRHHLIAEQFYGKCSREFLFIWCCKICFLASRQLEQQESRTKTEMEETQLRLSSLQEENRRLALDKAHLSADVKKMEADLELTRQVNRC